MIRNDWIADATKQLTDAGIDSARLDAELLLVHALSISRTSLHAHPDDSVPEALEPILDAMLSLRVIRVPLAYIIGHREFYGRLFKVTPSVLIPRPETEDIIDIIKELPQFASFIDVGTGSGALAITLALEFPSTEVNAIDISQRALTIAAQNNTAYETAITFFKADLLDGVELDNLHRPLCIVANLPYVDTADERSPETEHEPSEALFASDNGLSLIKRLIDQSVGLVRSGDYLLLESNPSQQPNIARYATENGFTVTQTRRLITVLQAI